MCDYIIHPLSIRISQDVDFFNKPQPDLHCLHCFGSIELHAPVGTPVQIQDTKLGSAHSREAAFLNHDTMHIHKLYCDIHCQLATSVTPNLTNLMLAKVYRFGLKCLDIRPALPFWTLIEFGGPLTRNQFRQWKEQGKITEFINHNGQRVILDYSQVHDVVQALREATLYLQSYNRFSKFVFDRNDPIWFQPLPENTRLCCWNCSYSLRGVAPTTAVLEYNTEMECATHCEGMFHDTSCKLSYVIRKNGQLTKLRLHQNKHFDSIQFYNGRTLHAQRAPARRLLKKFGGWLSIEQYLDPNQKYRLIQETPIQDFEVSASLTDEGLYIIENEYTEWDVLDLMRTDNNGNGHRTKFSQNTKYFPKVFHEVNHNNNFKLHFTIMVIPIQIHMKSNEEIMSRLISLQAEKEKEKEKLKQLAIEGTGAHLFENLSIMPVKEAQHLFQLNTIREGEEEEDEEVTQE